MGEEADRERIRRLMEAFGRAANGRVSVYLVGGTTAVLLGWRATTIDVDFVMRPDDEGILRAIPALKETLRVNLEIALTRGVHAGAARLGGPRDVRRPGRPGCVLHFDLYAQALAKVERGHRHDLADVREMIARGLIDRRRGLEYFARMEPELYRFPAIDPPSFRRAVEEAFAEQSAGA